MYINRETVWPLGSTPGASGHTAPSHGDPSVANSHILKQTSSSGDGDVSVAIDIPTDEIAAFCQRHAIRTLSLFGSVIRDDFTAESDVDVLVEFLPGTRVGFAFFSMQDELSEVFGRRVDLNTPQDLSHYYRDEVLREALVLYDAA